LNGFIALVFIIGGAVIGSSLHPDDMGVILGLLAGLLIAVVVNGLIAVFICCREELIIIRTLLEKIVVENNHSGEEKEIKEGIDRNVEKAISKALKSGSFEYVESYKGFDISTNGTDYMVKGLINEDSEQEYSSIDVARLVIDRETGQGDWT